MSKNHVIINTKSDMKKFILLNRVIFILAVIGILIASYVTQSFIRNTSIVCVNSGCELVRKSTSSYIYGIPVPAFGLIGYSIIAIASFLQTIKVRKFLSQVILGVSVFGVCFVSWFTYTEIFIIKGICTWCAISAVMMIFIFLLSLYSFKHFPKISS